MVAVVKPCASGPRGSTGINVEFIKNYFWTPREPKLGYIGTCVETIYMTKATMSLTFASLKSRFKVVSV